ncbi:glycosyltransferase family 4 protein [Aestuariivivens insulae]|uniref:glycosyltransferase family 4 protein n=1 Tax=Aestuariivivens insulae TaxID=1621988 RepID=UPI001F5732DF|nr:glycosyltransferase family 4 protein [Aestuariivivens insulae]
MDKRIKILFTISNFNTAGSGKVVYDLIKGLNQSQFDIEIACGHDQGEFFKTVAQLGVPIHVFSTKTVYRPYFTLFFRILKISKFYNKHQYDLVHSWQWSSDWTEALAAKLAGVKWLYTKKAMGFKSRHWKFKSYLADFIITINDEMRDYFPEKKNQRLIPLGLDTNYYRPLGTKNTPVQPSTLNLVMVANLVPVKGLETLIRALVLLPIKEFRLQVVGKCDNAYGKAMQQLVQDLGLEKQISFVGTQLDVRPYLETADIFVIPTLDEGRKEGMPMALVEAMSMGIPVLGSNITGIKFVLKDFNSLLFEPNNPQSLADKLFTFTQMSLTEREVLGKALRDYCKTHFSLETFVAAHEQLYKELLA